VDSAKNDIGPVYPVKFTNLTAKFRISGVNSVKEQKSNGMTVPSFEFCRFKKEQLFCKRKTPSAKMVIASEA